MAAQYMALDSFWVDKPRYDEAERIYYERLGNVFLTPLADEVARARQRLIEIRGNVEEKTAACILPDQRINQVEPEVNKDIVTSASEPAKIVEPPICSLEAVDTGAIKFLEKKITEFQNVLAKIESHMNAFDARLISIEKRIGQSAPAPAPAVDDDVDLFASESEEDEAADKVKEERLAAYNAKKSKKPALIAKSSVILDVKPWDDETDMQAMEDEVRKIKMDGLLWGASKLVPLAYGIHKLQINCVVEDEKVSIDLLQEQIEAIEDYVQSIDIAAFNKI